MKLSLPYAAYDFAWGVLGYCIAITPIVDTYLLRPQQHFQLSFNRDRKEPQREAQGKPRCNYHSSCLQMSAALTVLHSTYFAVKLVECFAYSRFTVVKLPWSCVCHLGVFNIHKCLMLKCDRQPCILPLCCGAIHNRGWTSSFCTLPFLSTLLLVAVLGNQFLFLSTHCINPVLCNVQWRTRVAQTTPVCPLPLQFSCSLKAPIDFKSTPQGFVLTEICPEIIWLNFVSRLQRNLHLYM